MRGLHRLFVERSLEILDGEVERGQDENLARALEVARALRSKRRVAPSDIRDAADRLALYAGDSDAVSKAAGVALSVVRRSDRQARR